MLKSYVYNISAKVMSWNICINMKYENTSNTYGNPILSITVL